MLLFINAVSEVYHQDKASEAARLKMAMTAMKKFLPMTTPNPMSLMGMMTGSAGAMADPDMIRIMSYYTMFGDFDKVFGTFLQQVRMSALMKKYGVKIRETNLLSEPWPMQVTEKTTKEEFLRLSASDHLGSEHYVEFERL